MTIVNDSVEQLEFSHTLSGSISWYNHIGKLFDVSSKIEYAHTL